MSDDLDDLKAAMNAATPAPDAGKKAEHLALARKNFADLQESRDGVRQTSDRPEKGLFRGVAKMFSMMSRRGALTASTALVALGLVAVVPNWQKGPVTFIPVETQVEFDDVVIVEERAREDARKELAAATELAQGQEEALVLEAEPQVFAAPSADMAAPETGLLGYADGEVQALSRIVTEPGFVPESNTESFPEAEESSLKITSEEPVSTFSIDVDTASYSVVRSSLMRGWLPEYGTVRVEEMINYFPYDYPAPQLGEAPFRPTVSVSDTPWNPGTKLVHIAIQGEKPAVEDRPSLNLVFLIDTSGSMDAPDKLPLLKQSLGLMLPELSERDQVSIVTYAGSAGQVLEPTPATERATIMAALDKLDAGGSTAGQAGLQQAYAVAEGMAEEGEVTRVILATDGDFNVGIYDPAELETFIADKRDSGTYLSVMGFGRGNLDESTMQALAQNGNGQASFIDTLSEAQKVLVDQFTGALFPIANDVKIQVEFNPSQIAEYRLIGYETRMLEREDFNNDKVDAGDIGAGHSVTAIYEVTPVGSPARLSDPLRYGEVEAASTSQSDELGFLKLRYKEPGQEVSQLIETPIVEGGEVSEDMRFATAIAGFGLLLNDSVYIHEWGFVELIDLANSARGDDPFGYRVEAIRLMRLAQNLQW